MLPQKTDVKIIFKIKYNSYEKFTFAKDTVTKLYTRY